MSKGVAIPYIIAVLLGIAVIGIIGYWFFFLGGSLGGEVSAQDCTRKLVTYCSIWLGQGYGGTSPAVGAWDEYAVGCSKLDPLKFASPSGSTCNGVLGRGETTGGAGEDITPRRPTAKISGALCEPDAPNNDGCPGPCVEDGLIGRCR